MYLYYMILLGIVCFILHAVHHLHLKYIDERSDVSSSKPPENKMWFTTYMCLKVFQGCHQIYVNYVDGFEPFQRHQMAH